MLGIIDYLYTMMIPFHNAMIKWGLGSWEDSYITK